MRVIVGITGSSGGIFGVEFLKCCPGEKYLILSQWGQAVLKMEHNLTVDDVRPYVRKVFSDRDLAAPFSSGSNFFDAFVIIPCSISTLAKISVGIADTLITRIAQVALKERRKLIIALRETPLPTNALENALKLSREGAIIMPISPPWYVAPATIDDVVTGFVNKVLGVLGLDTAPGWKKEELM